MITKEELDEIERNAKVWVVAYQNISDKNKELVVIDMKRAKILEDIEHEEKTKATAQTVINQLVKDYEDKDSEQAIENIINQYIAPVITKGMISE